MKAWVAYFWYGSGSLLLKQRYHDVFEKSPSLVPTILNLKRELECVRPEFKALGELCFEQFELDS